MRTSLAHLLVAASLAAPLASAGAQKVVTLAKHDAEFTDPFTQLSSVRELKDGRVIVSDRRDKTVQLIDFKSGATTKVGREGQGPGEYSLPASLIALPGDTTAIYDPFNSRYLLVGPDGKTGKDFRMEETSAGGPGGGIRIGGAAPKGTDARGRIYYEAPAFSISPDGPPRQADTAAVVRYDRATKKSDTVAWVHLPPTNIRVSGGRDNRNVMVMNNPFAPRDDWAVMPDGRVGVIRAADYHVDWYAPVGGRKAGPPMKLDRLPFSEADKEEYRKARRNAGGMTVRNENGVITRGAATPANIPDPEWPEYKAPFPQNAAFARPNGELWVAQARKASDKTPKYHVFDGQGKLLGTIVLPESTRLVGFGNGTVYTVRIDDDDLQYLRRHPARDALIAP